MAFGWIVFEIANDMVPYWQTPESGIIPPVNNDKIVAALAKLTDDKIASTLDTLFPEERLEPLRSFLRDALRVNPNARFTAERLRTERSLLGFRERSTNGWVVDRINQNTNRARDSIHDHLDKISAQLTASLQNVGSQLQVVADRGSDQEMNSIAEVIKVHKKYLKSSNRASDPEQLASTISNVTTSLSGSSQISQLFRSLEGDINAVLSEPTKGASSDEKLDAILAAIAYMQEQMREQNRLTVANTYILAELERRGNVMPHTFVIVPELRDEIPDNASKVTKLKNYILKKTDKLTGLLWERSRLHFFCPITRKRVPCGPDGKGYSISLPSKLLKTLLPAMKIGLVFLKVALASQGLGGMVPDLNAGISAFPAGQPEMENMIQLMSTEFSSVDATISGDVDASNFSSLTEKLADWENSTEEKVNRCVIIFSRIVDILI